MCVCMCVAPASGTKNNKPGPLLLCMFECKRGKGKEEKEYIFGLTEQAAEVLRSETEQLADID